MAKQASNPIVIDCSTPSVVKTVKIKTPSRASVKKRFASEVKSIHERKGTTMQYSEEAIDRFLVRAEEANVDLGDTKDLYPA